MQGWHTVVYLKQYFGWPDQPSSDVTKFVGFTLEAIKLVSIKHFTQVHLKISSRTLKNLTKYITWSIFAVKSVMHVTNAIVRQENREEMQILALLLTNT